MDEKQLLIDAIYGCGFRSMQTAIKMTEIGLARFVGNQWNEEWAWNKSELQKLSIGKLEAIYAYITT